LDVFEPAAGTRHTNLWLSRTFNHVAADSDFASGEFDSSLEPEILKDRVLNEQQV
jgi:hypothetical protein